jgi:hypothetical protein
MHVRRARRDLAALVALVAGWAAGCSSALDASTSEATGDGGAADGASSAPERDGSLGPTAPDGALGDASHVDASEDGSGPASGDAGVDGAEDSSDGAAAVDANDDASPSEDAAFDAADAEDGARPSSDGGVVDGAGVDASPEDAGAPDASADANADAADAGPTCPVADHAAPGTILCTGVTSATGPSHWAATFTFPGSPTVTLDETVTVSGGNVYAQVPLVAIAAGAFYTGPVQVVLTQDGTPRGQLAWTVDALTPAAGTQGTVTLKYLETARSALGGLAPTTAIASDLQAIDGAEAVVRAAQSASVSVGSLAFAAGAEALSVGPADLAAIDAFLSNASATTPPGQVGVWQCLSSAADAMICVGTAAGLVGAATVATPVFAAGIIVVLGSIPVRVLEAEAAQAAQGLPSPTLLAVQQAENAWANLRALFTRASGADGDDAGDALCAGVTCADDPCAGVPCSTPPAASCTDRLGDVGNTGITSYPATGTCYGNGQCSYSASYAACPSGQGNGVCETTPTGPVCVDECAGVTCSTPPAASCTDRFGDNGNTGITSYAATGTCYGSAQCRYSSTYAACPSGQGNGVCETTPSGPMCVDECAGVTCSTPPAASCTDRFGDNGNTGITSYAATGTCYGSAQCRYSSTYTACLGSAVCVTTPSGPVCQ